MLSPSHTRCGRSRPGPAAAPTWAARPADQPSRRELRRRRARRHRRSPTSKRDSKGIPSQCVLSRVAPARGGFLASGRSRSNWCEPTGRSPECSGQSLLPLIMWKPHSRRAERAQPRAHLPHSARTRVYRPSPSGGPQSGLLSLDRESDQPLHGHRGRGALVGTRRLVKPRTATETHHAGRRRRVIVDTCSPSPRSQQSQPGRTALPLISVLAMGRHRSFDNRSAPNRYVSKADFS